MRPDRDVTRCPSCRGQTVIPRGYGYPAGVQYGECPSCAGMGIVGAGDVSPESAAWTRQSAARDVRQARRDFRR